MNTIIADKILTRPKDSPRILEPIKAAIITLVSRNAETWAIFPIVKAHIAKPYAAKLKTPAKTLDANALLQKQQPSFPVF